MKLSLRQRVPHEYQPAEFQTLLGEVEQQVNLLAEGRLAGRHFTAASIPTVGSFARGDIIWNSAPISGGTVGWICVAAGSPGTLKAWGTIA